MKVSLFDELLSKEMTRKEFLIHIGLLLMAISGLSGIIRTITDPHISSGFGGGPYAGKK